MTRYRPEIDGLRALAVIPVILFHLDVKGLAGGFLGVDVFFVISGFLITDLILRDLSQKSFSYRLFLARRIRRLAPVLIAVVGTTVALTILFLPTYDYAFIGNQSVFALFSLANFYFYMEVGDYWGPAAEDTALLHTWSLSVEEQFYLGFPFAMALLFRRQGRWLGAALIALVISSFGCFLLMQANFERAAFYLLPPRIWELASGGLLAWWLLKRKSELPSVVPGSLVTQELYLDGLEQSGQPGAEVNADKALNLNGLVRPEFSAVAGLGFILIAYLWAPDGTVGEANRVSVVLGTLLVLAFATSGIANRCLTFRPMTFVGRISYSAYMWHWPIIYFASVWGIREWAGPWESLGIRLVAITSLSVVSYYVFEQTTRYREGVVRWILGAYTVVVVGAFALTMAGHRQNQMITEIRPPVCHHVVQYNLGPKPVADDWIREKRAAGIEIVEREAAPDAYLQGGFLVGPGSEPEMVLVGDSHGSVWAHRIRELAESWGIRTSIYTVNGVNPFVCLSPECHSAGHLHISVEDKRGLDEAKLRYISKWKPRIVLIAARWSAWHDPGPEDFLSFLDDHAEHVLLIGPVPETRLGRQNVAQYLTSQGVRPGTIRRSYLPMHEQGVMDRTQSELQELVDRHANCRLIPVFDVYSRRKEVLVLDGDRSVYFDGDHLSHYGTSLAFPRIEREIRRIMKGDTD